MVSPEEAPENVAVPAEPAPAPAAAVAEAPAAAVGESPAAPVNEAPPASISGDALIADVNELKRVLEGPTSSQDALLEALKKLRNIGELPTKVLSATLIGKSVNRLAKDSTVEPVRNSAMDLVTQWRQAHRKRKAGTAGLESRTISRTFSIDSEPGVTFSQTLSQDSLAVDGNSQPEPNVTANANESPPAAAADGNELLSAPANENDVKKEAPLTSQRKKVIEKLKDALVSSEKIEVKEGSMDDSDDTRDPVVLATEIEAVLHKDLGEKEKDYLNQARAILFNLKDKKNPTFKFKVLVGFIKPGSMSKLTASDMASDEKNAQRRKDFEDAMAAIDQDWAMKKGQIRISGMFTCGKCKGTQTTYFQMQTRSSDEPMTTFATCLTCGNRWKFC